MIRPANSADAPAIAEIYNHYIAHTSITFEEELVTGADMTARVLDNQDAGLPWLMAEDDVGSIVGYAYASKWKGRCAYRYSLEVTVYLAPDAIGHAWGSRLYEKLFAQLRAGTTHALIAGISLPNDASIALHEKFGMTKAGHFKEVGYKFGKWVDVGYWQCVLREEKL